MVLAPALHAFTQAPQPMQFFGYTINCGLTDRVSGLWHQLHAMLHPLKNTVVRIPGPSFSENRSISVITPFISCSPFFGIFAPRKQGDPPPQAAPPCCVGYSRRSDKLSRRAIFYYNLLKLLRITGPAPGR